MSKPTQSPWLSQRLWRYFAVALVVLVLDQLSKQWAEAALSQGNSIIVTAFFKFQLAYNPGAAFSFLGDASGWQRWLFTAIAVVVSGFIVVWIARVVRDAKPQRHWELLALSLVLGGALGNLYDRVMLGHVVDFIVWHYQHYYWPTFNIADAAICVGAALLIYDMLFVQPRSQGRETAND